MGKKDKNKKKGKGAAKTALKTEKKLSNKQKRELEALGEEDVETIIKQIELEEKKRLQVTEAVVEPPSRRVNFTFAPHPDKQELIIFGGEFFNGQKTFLYNDLFFYNIPNKSWTVIKAPAGPPPRCGHQMVTSSANKGQLWIFGGEFSNPTQTQFYHYRDLWVYHLAKKQWEKILSPNGPSARSGHRMVFIKKQIYVFGGYHDNLRDYKYFNDVYCFNTETYVWNKLEPSGTPPSPRSGCCMIPIADGRILIYGGYSKEKIKKDVDKGCVHTDAFILGPEKNDTTGTKWKWIQTKIGGIHFTPRCGMSAAVTANNIAFCFGGVFDTEDEENLTGIFYNDLYSLDLEKMTWRNVTVVEKKSSSSKINEKIDDTNKEAMDVEEVKETIENTTVSDDGVFKVTVGPSAISTQPVVSSSSSDETKLFQPAPRMNCGLAVKHGILYLYGGSYEDGDKQVTYSDFYALDVKKLNKWENILSDDASKQEWLGSDSESEKESESSSENESDSSMETE